MSEFVAFEKIKEHCPWLYDPGQLTRMLYDARGWVGIGYPCEPPDIPPVYYRTIGLPENFNHPDLLVIGSNIGPITYEIVEYLVSEIKRGKRYGIEAFEKKGPPVPGTKLTSKRTAFEGEIFIQFIIQLPGWVN